MIKISLLIWVVQTTEKQIDTFGLNRQQTDKYIWVVRQTRLVCTGNTEICFDLYRPQTKRYIWIVQITGRKIHLVCTENRQIHLGDTDRHPNFCCVFQKRPSSRVSLIYSGRINWLQFSIHMKQLTVHVKTVFNTQ